MNNEATALDLPVKENLTAGTNQHYAAGVNEGVTDGNGFESLPDNARWGFRFSQCFVGLALSAPCVMLSPLLVRATGFWIATVLVIALLALLLVWSWKLADRRHRAVRFRLDDEGLSLNRGVYWHSETHVPRSRVQHTDIQRGPLDRRLGLADLLIHTAGTEMATVRLAGLSSARATTLRDSLLEGHDQRF